MPKPVILITGASQGIGAAIATVFAKELPGCRLALVARAEAKLQAVAQRCRKAGAGSADVFPCDVSAEAPVGEMAEAVTRRFGAVDVLINNAGVFQAAPFDQLSVADFDRLVAANLRSVFLVSRALVPAMIKRRRGDIFNMSSIAGLGAYPGGAGYCAAKFGVTGLTQVMRSELRDKGIRVTLVCPGATISPSWKKSGVATEKLMPAEDVARSFVDVYRLSRRTVVEQIVLRPQRGDID
jgi:NADP-dependent 3-hydroxy acid dehydrogenase YdfG